MLNPPKGSTCEYAKIHIGLYKEIGFQGLSASSSTHINSAQVGHQRQFLISFYHTRNKLLRLLWQPIGQSEEVIYYCFGGMCVMICSGEVVNILWWLNASDIELVLNLQCTIIGQPAESLNWMSRVAAFMLVGGMWRDNQSWIEDIYVKKGVHYRYYGISWILYFDGFYMRSNVVN